MLICYKSFLVVKAVRALSAEKNKMASSREEAMFGEFSEGLSRLFAGYECGEINRRNRHAQTQINVPYSREVDLQRELSRLLRGADHLMTITSSLEGSIADQLCSGINSLQALVLPEEESRRQVELNRACGDYLREFEGCVARAFSLLNNCATVQSSLSRETREFNGRSAVDALRALSARGVSAQSVVDAASELGRINGAFLYDPDSAARAREFNLAYELMESRRYLHGRGGIGNK